jgi:hypothetical protein
MLNGKLEGEDATRQSYIEWSSDSEDGNGEYGNIWGVLGRV